MKNKPIVIGVGGFARAGKDTFVKIARNILEKNGYKTRRFAFADALKDEMNPFVEKYYGINVWTDKTSEKAIIRPLMVAHGCGKRVQTEGKYWVDKIDEAIRNYDGDVAFISDCRFPNEVEWVQKSWGGWFVHLRKYSVLSGMQYDSFTGKETGIQTWKQFDEAPNEEEAKNDPICEKNANYRLELESIIDRELRLTGNKITTEAIADNTYLNEEIKLCLTNCPHFSNLT